MCLHMVDPLGDGYPLEQVTPTLTILLSHLCQLSVSMALEFVASMLTCSPVWASRVKLMLVHLSGSRSTSLVNVLYSWKTCLS